MPLEGDGPPEPLLELTSFPTALNIGPDGSLYLDQFSIAVHVLRFPEAGGPPEKIARSTGAFTGTGPLELPDGRVLFSSVASGRTRLLAAHRGQVAAPFVQSDEDTSGPTALIGNHSVAFFMGSPPDIAIAIASTDGRIVRRLGVQFADFPGSLAASPDGRSLPRMELPAIGLGAGNVFPRVWISTGVPPDFGWLTAISARRTRTLTALLWIVCQL